MVLKEALLYRCSALRLTLHTYTLLIIRSSHHSLNYGYSFDNLDVLVSSRFSVGKNHFTREHMITITGEHVIILLSGLSNRTVWNC